MDQTGTYPNFRSLAHNRFIFEPARGSRGSKRFVSRAPVCARAPHCRKPACSEDSASCNCGSDPYSGAMYLRRCFRQKEGKRHAYWALVESYRTARGPRQRVVAYLGETDSSGRLGVQRAAEARSPAQSGLFESAVPAWVEVDPKRVRIERARQFGGAWLGYELLARLGLIEHLEHRLPSGREQVPWATMAMALVIGRLCDPSSELRFAEHGYEAKSVHSGIGHS